MTTSLARKWRHNIAVAAKRLRRRKRSIAKRASARASSLAFRRHLKDPRTGLAPRRLYAPRVFSALNRRMRPALLNFLSLLRDSVLRDRRRIHIDFSKTERMISDGTLLFYAELYRLTRMAGSARMISCNYPSDNVVEQVLQQIGVFRLLGKRERAKIDHDLVKHWNSATGTKVEGKAIEPVELFYQGTMASELTASTLYNGIIEAMSNCSHHAGVSYKAAHSRVSSTTAGADNTAAIHSEDDKVDSRWWMFSQCREGILTVVFCDLGIGVPASVRGGAKWKKSVVTALLSHLGLAESDGALIRAAFELGKSQTGEAHRGKGFQNIQQVLDAQGQGNLRVLSGHGHYEYTPATDDWPKQQLIQNHAQGSRGTLIFWSLPIKSGLDNGKHDDN